MKKIKLDWYIFLLLLIAFLLRLPGIIDGLPAVYNSTEHFLARTALAMGAAKSIDPGFYIYPTLYTYLLLTFFGCLYLFGGFFGVFANQYDFAVQFLIDPSLIYMFSRSINVALSLATIYILYKFLRHQTNITTAKIGAAIMALSYYLIRFSSFATADILLIFFSTMAILYIYQLTDSKAGKDYFIAGLFCGLAIAAKYNAGFLIFGLVIIAIQNWHTRQVKLVPSLGLSFGGVALGFFVTNPLWLIYPDRFYQGWRLISSQMYHAVSADRGEHFVWEITQIIQHELVFGSLFILGTVFFIFRKEKKHYPVLLVVLLTFFYVGTWTKKGIDYLFAVFPAWIILGSSFLEYILKTYIQNRRLKIIIVLFIFLPSFASAVHQFILHTNQDTREAATEWIVTEIQKDYTVCYDNYHNDLGVFDIERYLSYGASADRLPDIVKQKLIPFSTDPRQISLIPILVLNSSSEVETDNAYEEIALKYRRCSLDELIGLETSFLISNSWFYDSYSSIEIQDYPPGVQISIKEVKDFYQQLNDNHTPIKVFEPNFWTPGPKISIYDLRNIRSSIE
jgi:hypothetical protein